MAIHTPSPQTTSVRPAVQAAVTECDGPEPAELLIREARRRAQRRRLAIGAAAAAFLGVAAIAATAALNDRGPLPRQVSSSDPPVVAASYGVFEPVRGWIVYPVGHELRAVDPTDPSHGLTVAVPDLGLPADAANLVPAGWSADGTRLALTSEGTGYFVMDASGAISKVADHDLCCWFVTEPWLSPDGTTVLEPLASDQLRLRSLAGADASRVIQLHPPFGAPRNGILPSTAAWSLPSTASWAPDGTRIAYSASRRSGTDLLPTVSVVDIGTGVTRQLVRPGLGHIRQLAWSPDGSQLLVVAGPWRVSTKIESHNPLVYPLETSLYVVDVRDPNPAHSAWPPREIASGYYVAAAWSPDGAQIAAIEYGPYGENGPAGRRLVSMRADGSDPRILVDLAEGQPPGMLFTGLAWHPQPDR